MKNIILLLFPLLLLIPMTSESQSFVKSERINFTDINLRDSLHVLAHIDAFIPVPGDVIIRFTGECYTSPGDWTILAANNAPKWDKNFGNVGVQSTDSTIGKSFSHSKIVKYSKSDTGIHSYYAVAQDWGYMAGSGIVSVYGTLTIEFLPYGSLYSMAHGSFAFNGDVTKIVFATQETVFASSVGKIITHMDGWGHTNVGDRIIYAVSNSSLWLPDDGNVSVEAADPTLDVNTFSHTRVYNVPFAGPYIYNALIQNSEETDGNGTVLVYGLIRSTFYSSTGPVQVESQGFSKPNVDLNDQFISLTSVSIDVPEAGDVLVELDGELISDPGDMVKLGVSDGLSLPDNDGNVTLRAITTDLNRNCYAHSRVYKVIPGQHTFYAVGKIPSAQAGSGIANVTGELTVKYFPDQTSAVTPVATSKNEFSVYPDPTFGMIMIKCENKIKSDEQVRIMDCNGRIVASMQGKGEEEITFNFSAYPSGIYFVSVGDTMKKVVKE